MLKYFYYKSHQMIIIYLKKILNIPRIFFFFFIKLIFLVLLFDNLKFKHLALLI